jgi:hypothetical protein
MIARGGFTTLIVAGSFALAACGGGDSGGGTASTPAPTPTQPVAQTRPAAQKKVRQTANFPARFEDRVDRICSRTKRRAKVIVRRGYKSMDDVHAAVVVIEDLATDLETTKAPTRNKRAWRGYTRQVRDVSNALDRLEIEAADGDFAALKRVAGDFSRYDRRLTRASRGYGFEVCASD